MLRQYLCSILDVVFGQLFMLESPQLLTLNQHLLGWVIENQSVAELQLIFALKSIVEAV